MKQLTGPVYRDENAEGQKKISNMNRDLNIKELLYLYVCYHDYGGVRAGQIVSFRLDELSKWHVTVRDEGGLDKEYPREVLHLDLSQFAPYSELSESDRKERLRLLRLWNSFLPASVVIQRIIKGLETGEE